MKNYVLLICFMMTAGMVSAQALKVAANGFVGINQATPTQRIHLSGVPSSTPGFLVEATGSNFVKAAAGTTASAFFYQSNRFFTVVPGANSSTVSADPTKSFAVVGDDANVGIGTWAPTEKLEVNGNIKYAGGILSSDKRLKKKIRTFDKGIDEVMKLNPVSYEYNGKGGTVNNTFHIGIVAQELEAVVPEMVSTFEHIEFEAGSLGEDLRVEKSKEEYLQIHDTEIKYLLINAIKDQQVMIENLQEELAQLKNIIQDIGSKKEVNLQDDGSTVFSLDQNTPNPYASRSTIKYVVPSNTTQAQMVFFDLTGKMIKTVALTNGQGELNVNASDVPSGTLTYSLVIDGKIVETKKMTVSK